MHGSISPSAETYEPDEPGVLDTITDGVLFEVEAVPTAGAEFDNRRAVSLLLRGELVGYLDSDIAGDMHPLIRQANSLGFAVKMTARMHAAYIPGWDRCLELRGTWPSHLRAWLSLPAQLRGTEFFEIEWVRALWGEEFQTQRHAILSGTDQLITECRLTLHANRAEVDVSVSQIPVATISAGYDDECADAVRRVESGQHRGYAKLRRTDDGHIVVGVSIAESDNTTGLQHRPESFLWPDEQEAEEAEERARFERARIAALVDGKDFNAWADTVQTLKRGGKNKAAIGLLERMLDAQHAACSITGDLPAAWVTEQAAIVYRKLGDNQAEIAVLQRYLARFSAGRGPDKIRTRLRRILD